MKKIFSLLAITIAFTFMSCSDDEASEKLEGNNMVSIEFDNSFNGDDLILGSTYVNGNEETLKISAFDYIVSNFVLVTETGEEYVYPKEKSYFIISEGGQTIAGANKTKNVKVMLENVPAGNYTKIKFGIGVDQERYTQGQAAQEDFWTKAENYALTWSWQAGYKFVVLEGDFTSETQVDELPFKLHIASRGTAVDLYKEVELGMNVALVSSNKSPQIHIVVDANKMLDGAQKINLSEEESIMGGDKAAIIADNNIDMFTVHHVHNGDGSQQHN
ncbi:MbnP family protein [Tenacibaculum sp. IB213877]|uniref:MbnP family protein n=1 Tax=Tenacibaculum sp. IB213877 TaxID=3097351 RepID=UPI002A5A64DB|nr:MbnP family protein [Tenacibaculum sp. IB213877]MDY0780520.1 MbnP family protein [Tenacibaculum sp. IB213877]